MHFSDYVLVVGGWDGSVGLDTVEWLSLDPANNPLPEKLRTPSHFPENIRGAVGMTLGERWKFTPCN